LFQIYSTFCTQYAANPTTFCSANRFPQHVVDHNSRDHKSAANIFAVMTAFFGVYLGFREATQGIVMNILRRKMPAEKIKENLV
ncbi:hypothetical protein MJN51_39900, partial [Salmonella enterica subsp. enterica serovar Kentucky]|nr:hypothetical protein [Salmonella enterica subsp. enterica serovar Kentucky]